MGHYDCDDCGEFGCVCRRITDSHGNSVKYHVTSILKDIDYIRIFVSQYWGPESLKKHIERKYFNIPGEVMRNNKTLTLFDDPTNILKEIL